MVGCAGTHSYYVYNVDYTFQMKVADRKKAGEDLHTNVGEISRESANSYAFRDSSLYIVIAPVREKFTVAMRSETGEPVRLKRDSIAFVDIRGRLHQVEYKELTWNEWTSEFEAYKFQVSGNLYPQGERGIKENAQRNSLGSNTKSIGLVSPQFGAARDTAEGGDKSNSAIQTYLDREARQNVGQMIGLILPVKIAGTGHRYTFWFRVQDYSIRPPVLTQSRRGLF